MKKIFVTGGHFAPAKAVIQELLRRGRLPAGRQGWQIYYVGRKYATEGSTTLALEYSEIHTLPVHYLTITTGRIQRQFFVNVGQSILALLKIFIGLLQSFWFVLRYHPDVVLSFGSYVAVPVAIWAWIFQIPIITHEQTTVYGRANKLIALLADKILVSWPESVSHFPREKVILTGNPIREEILHQKQVSSIQSPVIYVTGGSQGAKAIDQVIPEISQKYPVISGQLSGQDSARALAKASLVVSRAGANTVAEILALGKPAILIPLPNTFGHEQEKNAQLVTKVGLGEILEQKDLSAKSLQQLIDKMFVDKQKYLANAAKAKSLINPNAANLIVDELEK